MTPAREVPGRRQGEGSRGREPSDGAGCARGARSWWRRHRVSIPWAVVAALLLGLLAFVRLSGAENPADGAERTVTLEGRARLRMTQGGLP